MSLDMGMSFATVIMDLTTTSGAPKLGATSPTAKTKAVSNADMRRMVQNDMRHLIPTRQAARQSRQPIVSAPPDTSLRVFGFFTEL